LRNKILQKKKPKQREGERSVQQKIVKAHSTGGGTRPKGEGKRGQVNRHQATATKERGETAVEKRKEYCG